MFLAFSFCFLARFEVSWEAAGPEADDPLGLVSRDPELEDPLATGAVTAGFELEECASCSLLVACLGNSFSSSFNWV